MKTVLITSSSDWTDASADLIEVPDGLDMAIAHNDYRQWYRVIDRKRDEYLTFIEWLKAHRGATASNVETFEES